MLQIYKCFKVPRSLTQAGSFRFMSQGHCPKYECKRAVDPDTLQDEKDEQDLRDLYVPDVLKCHPHKDPKTYRNIFFFVCCPCLILFYLNMFYLHEEHIKRPKFVPFSYLRIRNKPSFPWGDKTLFHNPRVNALPDGYEDTDFPEEDEIDPFEND